MTKPPTPGIDSLPPVDLRQFRNLTDDTGILQHAAYAAPDRDFGYCTDDNARALLAGLLWSRSEYAAAEEEEIPIFRYLSFLAHAFNEESGRFRNFMGYDRRWLEEVGSEDSHGRALWALGAACAWAPNDTVEALARRLFKSALRPVEKFSALRPWAFTLLGLDFYLERYPEDEEAAGARERLGGRLFETLKRNEDAEWPWWEDIVTYDNAKLPHALLLSGAALEKREWIGAALRSLEWLFEVQTAPEGYLDIIGNRGWLTRDGKRARFDQQPLEAHALLSASLAAAEFTGEALWRNRALNCLGWFLGRNVLGVPLYNQETGGCQDGLTPEGVNLNQGAESTLAYLLSVLELHVYRQEAVSRTRTSETVHGLGIVGAGAFARFCLESYRGIEKLKPVAVWSRTPARAEEFAGRYELKAVGELRELVTDPAISIIYVATPPARHAEHALAALEEGRHILCEKPLAVTVSDAERMIAAARAKGVKLGVNFVMRYGPLWKPVKDLVESRILGSLLRGDLLNAASDSGLFRGHWFWDEFESGGIFVEHGVHFFDLARSWLGAGRVLSAHRTARRETGEIDQVQATVLYGEETLFSFYHGFHQASALDRQELRLVCERGEAVLRGWVAGEVAVRALLKEEAAERLSALFPGSKLTVEKRLEGRDRIQRGRGKEEEADGVFLLTWKDDNEPQARYAEARRDLMVDFIRSIEKPDHRPRVTASDGLEALRIALRADRLSRGG